MEKPDPTAVLKLMLSSLDDDLFDKTNEEVQQELAEAGVDLAESERRWLKLERDALARLRRGRAAEVAVICDDCKKPQGVLRDDAEPPLWNLEETK